MKKFLTVLFLAILTLALAACSTNDEESSNSDGDNNTEDTGNNDTNNATDSNTSGTTEKLVVGASYGIHELVLKQAQPILEKEGIELVVEGYQDYVLPNEDLASGELDANYFQHIPYLENEIKEKGYDFVNAGGIHIEPIGVYSKKYKTLDELPDGATIIISNSVTDQGRILTLFETLGVIKLKEDVVKADATLDDIVENPKNIKFDADSPPEMLVSYYENDEGDAVIINSNYAIDAKIDPNTDSIAIEQTDSPYVNVVAVRSEDKDKESIKKLVEVLKSEEIQQFMLDEWKGAVVPVKE